MRISDWSSDVCSSDLPLPVVRLFSPVGAATWLATEIDADGIFFGLADLGFGCPELGSFALAELEAVRLPFGLTIERSEEHTSELQSLMRISYAVFCLKKKNYSPIHQHNI